MGLTATPREILTSRVTNIVLRSDRGNWKIGNPGTPVFTVAGAVGDSILDQVILDPFTAVVSMKSAQANAVVILTDGTNNDGTSINVYGAAQFTALGRAVVDDSSKVSHGAHNQSDRDLPAKVGQH
jgi:hypothetical protein